MVGKKLSESKQAKERITGTEDNVKETFHADINVVVMTITFKKSGV